MITEIKNKNQKTDGIFQGQPWFYSDTLKNHFFNPRNFLAKDKPDFKANGIGMVGSPACGDMMKMWLKIEPKTERIKKCVWKTFGCAAALAATSMLSVMITEKGGMSIDKALKIKPEDIIKKLGGLPYIKYHCSVLGDKALRAAINDYFVKTKQENRIFDNKIPVIDKVLNITEQDILEAVKSGAKTLKEVQSRTKVGTGDPSCIPKVKKLIEKFNKELKK